MKKIVSLILALCMVLAIGAAFAAPTQITTGSITVKNAANGETYYAIKAMDAIVSEDGITYVKPIPEALQSVFEVKTITEKIIKDGAEVGTRTYETIAKKDGVTDDDVQTAMRTFAGTDSSKWGTGVPCTGNSVTFSGLATGYYVIVSTLNGATTNKVSAGSTFGGTQAGSYNANGTVYEKNETIPQPEKKVGDKSYSIGDTITYTVTFPGANYIGSGDDAEIVVKYRVSDTLPDFLSGATVTEVKVGSKDITSELTLTGFATDKYFDIPWATGTHGNYTSKYQNGTIVTIKYTAVLTDVVNVNAENTNTVTVTPYVDRDKDEPEPYEKPWSDSEVITTYAAALKKVDENGYPLAGAKFKFAGLQTEKTADGIYTVISTTATSANETEMEVDANGMLYIVGLKESASLTGTETVPPAGYNQLTSNFTLTPQVLTKEVYKASGVRYYDADGNLLRETSTYSSTKTVEKNLSELDPEALQVVNNKGTELPHTGGIGTTIFYILGGLLVIGAAVILVARRKAHD